MRARILASAAIVAWSKTAAMPAVHALTQEQGTSVPPATQLTDTPPPDPTPVPPCTYGPLLAGPHFDGSTVTADAQYAPGYKDCSGTLSVQVLAQDGSRWKTLGSSHTVATNTSWDTANESVPCLPGTWSYRAFYALDDHSYKGSTAAVAFTC